MNNKKQMKNQKLIIREN